MKYFFVKVVFLFFVFLSCSVGFAFSADLYVVAAERLNLREKPDVKARVLRVLDKGALVEALGKENGWLEVRYGTMEGYLMDRRDYVRPISAFGEGKDQRAALDEQIRKEKKNVEEYRKKERDAVSELDRIDKNLQSLNKRLELVRKEQEALLENRKKILETQARLERENREKKQLIAKRLIALYKLESTGRMAFFTEARSVYDFAVQKKALQEILDLDKRILGEQAAHIRETRALSEKLKKEESRIALAAQKEADQIRQQAAEKKKREALVAYANSQQKKGLTNLDSLERAARQLDRTMVRLAKESKAPQSIARPDAPSRTEPSSRSAGGNSGGAVGFARNKGKLDLPVTGRIISRFGQQRGSSNHITLFNKGMGIAAKTGSPIRALYSGTVVYSSWLNAYGNIIILDHGDHYFSVYAHAESLLKKTGDQVRQNEIIARVGETGSLNGPMLYFEIRQNGEAINPDPWLKKT